MYNSFRLIAYPDLCFDFFNHVNFSWFLVVEQSWTKYCKQGTIKNNCQGKEPCFLMTSENDAGSLLSRKLIQGAVRLWKSRYRATCWWSVCQPHFTALHVQEVMSLQNFVAYTFFLPSLWVTFPSPVMYILTFDCNFTAFWVGGINPYCSGFWGTLTVTQVCTTERSSV